MKSLSSIFRFFPFLFIFGLIFFLSSQTGSGRALLPFWGGDKLLHFSIYFVFGLSFIIPFYKSSRPNRLHFKWLKVAFLVALVNALFDETHQSFVPGRMFDLWDAFFDVLGFVLAAFVYVFEREARKGSSGSKIEKIRKQSLLNRFLVIWPFLVVMGFECTGALFDLTDLPGKAFWIWQAVAGLGFGIFWLRYVSYELWWQSKSDSLGFKWLGIALGGAFWVMIALLKTQTRSNPWPEISLSFGFWILGALLWFLGFKMAAKLEPEAPSENGSSCALPPL